MTTDRDPRVDPKPGDVLEKKYKGQSRGSNERTVDEVYDDCVTQPCPRNRRVVYTGDNVCAPDIGIRSWRRWAAGATVIRCAEEKGSR
jgi:hypothetical protein